ncbi:MAG: hypothetical protein ACOCV4_00750 [Myxococcota bacterium]
MRGPRAGAGRRLVVLSLSALAAAVPVHAQEPVEDAADPIPIPLPSERSAHFAGEVHLDAVFPVATEPLCPPGAECIFGSGAGVGAIFERRWRSGWAIGGAYDLWILDGNGVHEVTTIQNPAVSLRYRFLRRNMSHPFVAGQIGALLLGDSFGVAAAGGSVEGIVGVEIEMSPNLALVVASAWRLFMTSSFETGNDDVRRVEDQGVNLGATLRLGLAFLP